MPRSDIPSEENFHNTPVISYKSQIASCSLRSRSPYTEAYHISREPILSAISSAQPPSEQLQLPRSLTIRRGPRRGPEDEGCRDRLGRPFNRTFFFSKYGPSRPLSKNLEDDDLLWMGFATYYQTCRSIESKIGEPVRGVRAWSDTTSAVNDE